MIETTGLANPGPVAQIFFMDNTVADAFLLDAIITLVDAKHANAQLDQHEVVQRQVGFVDRLFITKSDLISADELEALKHRLLHINPRATIKEIFDLRGFNLNSKLELDPDFLAEDDHDHKYGHDQGHHHAHHDDKIKSFVYRSAKPFDPNRLEDFLGGILQIYGERLLRYKGVLYSI